jgi:hypothetical protein
MRNFHGTKCFHFETSLSSLFVILNAPQIRSLGAGALLQTCTHRYTCQEVFSPFVEKVRLKVRRRFMKKLSAEKYRREKATGSILKTQVSSQTPTAGAVTSNRAVT